MRKVEIIIGFLTNSLRGGARMATQKGDIFVDKSAIRDFLEKWDEGRISSDADKCHQFNWPRIFRALRLLGILLVTGELSETISKGTKISKKQEQIILTFSINLLFLLFRRKEQEVSIKQLACLLERYARPMEEGGLFPRGMLPEYIPPVFL